MSHQHSQPAKKIFIISGSTFNEGTPQKISSALVNSNFLDDWAVIIAIHSYFKLGNKNHSDIVYQNKIKSDFSGFNIYFIAAHEQVAIKKGLIYVLPDPEVPKIKGQYSNDRKLLNTTFLNTSYQQKIKAENSKKTYMELEEWLNANPYDASNIKREITAEDILSLNWKQLPLRNVPNPNRLRQAALKLQPGEIMHREQPYLDKFMIEVANSNTKVKLAALLLCGLYGDGANGLEAIKKYGGNTAVQIPEECCHSKLGKDTSSMPTTALRVDPAHQKISLENTPKYLTLTKWLSQIKA